MIFQVTHTITQLVEAENSDKAKDLFYDRARDIIRNPEKQMLQVVYLGEVMREKKIPQEDV